MNYEQYAERAKRMNPIDDDFFKKMAEDVAFCEETIQTILDDKTIKVIDLKPQDFVKNLQGRSVVLDAHCVSEKDGHFSVEVQKSDDDNHQKRVRYNGACITANIMDTGSKFEKLPDVCSIYISKNDFFKGNHTVYHVERRIRETGEVLNNGFREVYVNAQVKDSSQVSQLMTIFTENDAYDYKKFPATSKRKGYFKKDEKGVGEMCAIMQEVKKEGQFELMVALYRNGEMSADKISAYLGMTEEEFLRKEKECKK